MSKLRPTEVPSPSVPLSFSLPSPPSATPLARVDSAPSFREVLHGGTAAVGDAPDASNSTLRDFAERIARGERTMDAAIRRSQRGQSLSQLELIALQMGVYRYTQELELGSRLVDRATGALKQVLQSQT